MNVKVGNYTIRNVVQDPNILDNFRRAGWSDSVWPYVVKAKIKPFPGLFYYTYLWQQEYVLDGVFPTYFLDAACQPGQVVSLDSDRYACYVGRACKIGLGRVYSVTSLGEWGYIRLFVPRRQQWEAWDIYPRAQGTPVLSRVAEYVGIMDTPTDADDGPCGHDDIDRERLTVHPGYTVGYKHTCRVCGRAWMDDVTPILDTVQHPGDHLAAAQAMEWIVREGDATESI